MRQADTTWIIRSSHRILAATPAVLVLLLSLSYDKEIEAQRGKTTCWKVQSSRAGHICKTQCNSKTSLASTASKASYVGHDLLISVSKMVSGPSGVPAGPTPQRAASAPANGAPGRGDQKTLEDIGQRHQVKRNAKPYQLLSQPLQSLPKIWGWLFCCFHLSVLGETLTLTW